MRKRINTPTQSWDTEAVSPTSPPDQMELMICQFLKIPVKGNLAGMELPIFGLTKNADCDIQEFRRGNKSLRIFPSSQGAATVHDEDLLLFVASQIVENLNRNLPVSRKLQIESTDFLRFAGRGDGRASFERILGMLRRLKGTTIETNIPTGKDRITQTEGFSLIDHYKVLSKKISPIKAKDSKTGEAKTIEVERVLSFTVTISQWLFNALLNFEVLTYDPAYFKLTRPLDRRLYAICRKHCGDKPIWKIHIDSLAEKIGTVRERFKVRSEIRRAVADDQLPQYRIAFDPASDQVVFYVRDTRKLHMELARSDQISWYTRLERSDNHEKWRGKKLLATALAA